MALPRKYLIHVTYFSEYLFRVFMSMTNNQRQNLSDYEQKMLCDEKAIHKFVTNEPLEKLLFLYTKIGGEWTLNLGPDEGAIKEAMESTRYQYDHSQKRLDAIEVIIRNQACTLSSRDVMALAVMCAQNCATEVYHISKYTRDMIARSGDIIRRPYDQTIAVANESANIANKMLLEQLNALPLYEETHNLEWNDLRVLSALFDKRNSTMSLGDLSTMTRQPNRKKYVGKTIDKLIGMGLVMSDYKEGEVKAFGTKDNYMITTKGIGKIMEYLYYVWEKGFGTGK